MLLTLIDRQMIRGYFKSYLVCLVSLLSLYVVVDLFTNLDDFMHREKGLAAVVLRITTYYGYKVTQIFDRLCEAIVLLAAMFTVAFMQRNNEQIPLLSAGVSTQRIVAPVLFCACVMLSLSVVNQELIIPRIADKLGLDRDDPGGQKNLLVHGAYEPNNIHITGDSASRWVGSTPARLVRKFQCLIPENLAGNQIHITAEEAHYQPSDEPHKGRWMLINCVPRDLESIPNLLEVADVGENSRYYLTTRNIDFDALTRNPNWFQLASTSRLYEELQRPESTRLAAIAVLFHTRLTRPVLGLVLVFLGLSVILRDQNRNVIVSSGLCLVLCGVFFAACYACKMLGDNEYLSPALSAWMPVLCFGPFSLVMFDAVHT
jgi:lipopolysaccharide export system permease protein